MLNDGLKWIWFELLSSILTNQHKGSWIRYLTRLRKHKGSTLASKWLYKPLDDKVTVLESEKRAWENSPEAQAMREALNPWRNHDAQERKNVPGKKFDTQLTMFTGIDNELILPCFDPLVQLTCVCPSMRLTQQVQYMDMGYRFLDIRTDPLTEAF
ncbi:hypothetical protein GOBAR_AA21172 [Gossypium barbadense]|uniref:Uncharacterized protein n=1 Tax=Gossypium barbadense TaxID=3634 RepID=A0A2P5X819_GOSBA|nr:hypothetical protein GOBAR_AA21172 [Gossypium barbadense]